MNINWNTITDFINLFNLKILVYGLIIGVAFYLIKSAIKRVKRMIRKAKREAKKLTIRLIIKSFLGI